MTYAEHGVTAATVAPVYGASSDLSTMVEPVLPYLSGGLLLFAAAIAVTHWFAGGSAVTAMKTLGTAAIMAIAIGLLPSFMRVFTEPVKDKDGKPLFPFTFGDPSETSPTNAPAATPPPTQIPPPITQEPSAHTTAPSAPHEPDAPPFEWSTVGPMLAIAAGLVAIGMIAYFGGSALLHRREVRREELKTARMEAQKAAAARKGVWEKACAVLGSVTKDYSDFENDMQAVVLERAFLADITTPATAAFHLDYDKALGLQSTAVPDDQVRVDEFAAAAAQARRSFDAANRFAQAKYEAGQFPGGYKLEPEQTDRLRKTITLATHQSTPAAEAAAAMRKVNELAQQWGLRIPKNIRGDWRPALEAAERVAITA